MCAPARTARLEPPPSPAQMTPIPASCGRLLCSGLVLIMSENAAPQDLGAGDHSPTSTCADGPRRRAKLLTTELAVECATKMFAQRADGLHATEAELISVYPTIEEIAIVQAAVLEAIGEKGSEKRVALPDHGYDVTMAPGAAFEFGGGSPGSILLLRRQSWCAAALRPPFFTPDPP